MKKNILDWMIIAIFMGIDYAYPNIYYSFTIFGFFLIYFFKTRTTEKHSILHYFIGFILIPIIFKTLIIWFIH